jgi:hypothetical protein
MKNIPRKEPPPPPRPSRADERRITKSLVSRIFSREELLEMRCLCADQRDKSPLIVKLLGKLDNLIVSLGY